MEIFAQILGIIATCFNILSYQGKTQKRIMQMQFVSSLLFSTHFFLMGAYTGGVLNFLGIFRDFAFMSPKRSKALIPIFCSVFAVYYVCNCLFLMQDPTLFTYLLEALPPIAMCVTTVAFFMTDASTVRLLSLGSSPLWLVYNVVNFSIGGIITETFAIISILVGMFRLDRRKK